MNGSREKEMSHKNSRGECTGDMKLVRLCFKCGDVADAPEVQAVLTAAKTWEIAYTSEDGVAIEKIFAARNNLIAAVRDYKERNAKDE